MYTSGTWRRGRSASIWRGTGARWPHSCSCRATGGSSLQEEALTEGERRAQRYVEDDDVHFSHQGFTVLLAAAEGGDSAVVQLLLAKGADVRGEPRAG